MNRHLNKLYLMMKDSLIIRARDRHFIRLIITQDRSIRFIHVRLTITRAHARLTTHGTVTAEDMAEDTDIKRRFTKMGAVQLPIFLF